MESQVPRYDVMRDGLTVAALVRCFRRNIRTILFIMGAFAIVGAAIALLQQPVFRARMVFALVPPPFVEQTSSLGGLPSLGALGRMAGINLADNSDLTVNLEVLKSNVLIREFLEARQLRDQVVHASRGRWRIPGLGMPEDPTEQAVEYFRKRVRSIMPTATINVYQLSIDWTDPQEAAAWANGFLEFGNDRLRTEAAKRTEQRLDFLRQRLQRESIVPVQESLAQLMADEMKRLTSTADVDTYAFRTIDPAVVPSRRAKPQRTLIVLLAMTSGLLLGFLYVLARDSARGLLDARSP